MRQLPDPHAKHFLIMSQFGQDTITEDGKVVSKTLGKVISKQFTDQIGALSHADMNTYLRKNRDILDNHASFSKYIADQMKGTGQEHLWKYVQ